MFSLPLSYAGIVRCQVLRVIPILGILSLARSSPSGQLIVSVNRSDWSKSSAIPTMYQEQGNRFPCSHIDAASNLVEAVAKQELSRLAEFTSRDCLQVWVWEPWW
jgi:hypothetical protein